MQRAPEPPPVMQREERPEVPPGVKLPDGRWSAGTLVETPHGVRARVLPCFDTSHTCEGDVVFVHPVRHRGELERPWQLWSSAELTVTEDGPDLRPVTGLSTPPDAGRWPRRSPVTGRAIGRAAAAPERNAAVSMSGSPAR